MKNRTGIIATLLLTALAIGILAGGGSSSDPLVSVSYLDRIFIQPYQKNMNDMAYDLYWTAVEDFDEEFLIAVDAMHGRKDKASAVAQRLYQDWLNDPTRLTREGPVTVTLNLGDTVQGPLGSQAILLSGTASAVQRGGLLDLYEGAPVQNGADLPADRLYMLAENDGSLIRVTSATATFRLATGAYVLPGYTPKYTERADTLKALGLFLGSDAGYELERVPTRQEALIMLIRMLGEEEAAKNYTEPSPFTDLTGWEGGKAYIAYGAAKKYTSGTTATTFSQDEPAALETYLTFLLRALGYSDTAGDFVWDTTSKSLAVSIGLLTQQQLEDAQNGFYRDHVVLISYNALNTLRKDGSATLGQSLVNAGVITPAQLALVK